MLMHINSEVNLVMLCNSEVYALIVTKHPFINQVCLKGHEKVIHIY